MAGKHILIADLDLSFGLEISHRLVQMGISADEILAIPHAEVVESVLGGEPVQLAIVSAPRTRLSVDKALQGRPGTRVFYYNGESPDQVVDLLHDDLISLHASLESSTVAPKAPCCVVPKPKKKMGVFSRVFGKAA